MATQVIETSDPDVSNQLIGHLLLNENIISADDLEKALDLQTRVPGRLGAILIRIGALSEDGLLPVLARQLQMPLLSSAEIPNDFMALASWLEQTGLEIDWWLDQELIAWEQADGEIFCVARDPINISNCEILERIFPNKNIQWALIRGHELEQALGRLASAQLSEQGWDQNAGRLRELAEEAPVIEFVNNLIAQACDQNASDIHIEPEEYAVQVRYRIDGVLYTRVTLPSDRFRGIVTRIKLISGMDIAENRLPQDGHLDTRVSGQSLDIRVSALPGVFGESIVMRLLPKEKQRYDLASLGLEQHNQDSLSRWISEPHGIILVTGPTGSGKSTTLYAMLESINDGDKKIITVEDPVEYRFSGITQVQTKEEIGYSFSRALRSILRQDPDVVMIGEIRDQETAEIAIQASLTGHLVLSTLHTNDAISSFTRLIDMGVEPFLVATPIRAVVAQRLVRKLCQKCARPVEPNQDILDMVKNLASGSMDEKSMTWLEPVGCDLCHGTGFSGRIGIHEVVPVTPELQHGIVNGSSANELTELARKQGVRSLREDGFMKACRGITSIDEVLRVTTN